MKTKTCLYLIVLAALFGATPLYAQHTKDSLSTVKKNIQQKKAVLLDVREFGEWREGHLEIAKHMALSKLRRGIDPQKLVEGLDKKTIVYCH